MGNEAENDVGWGILSNLQGWWWGCLNPPTHHPWALGVVVQTLDNPFLNNFGQNAILARFEGIL